MPLWGSTEWRYRHIFYRSDWYEKASFCVEYCETTFVCILLMNFMLLCGWMRGLCNTSCLTPNQKTTWQVIVRAHPSDGSFRFKQSKLSLSWDGQAQTWSQLPKIKIWHLTNIVMGEEEKCDLGHMFVIQRVPYRRILDLLKLWYETERSQCMLTSTGTPSVNLHVKYRLFE